MPRFIAALACPADLSAMARAYLECAEFTKDEEEDWSAAAWSPEALTHAQAVCSAFEEAHADDLAKAGDARQNGHDLWYTRNGHGVGFWDRDYPEDIAARLTAAAEALGTADAYLGDDGLIYIA